MAAALAGGCIDRLAVVVAAPVVVVAVALVALVAGLVAVVPHPASAFH